MFNKNLVLGLVVVVLLGGGAIFYFSGNGGSIPNSPVSRQGELTRELAKQMLLQEYQDKPKVYDAGYYESPHYGYTMIGTIDTPKAHMLSDRGVIDKVKEQLSVTSFDFTEEGKKYLTTPTYNPYPDKPTKDVGVILGHFKNLEVVGIHKLDETNSTVQFEIQYTLTPFGEVLKPDLVNVKSGGVLRLYDDGWRLGL